MRNGQEPSPSLPDGRPPGGPSGLSAWKAIVAALTAGALILAMTVLAGALFEEPVAVFTRDGSSLGGLPWYSGSVSMLNTMVWAAVTALALLVAWLEPRDRLRLTVLGGFVLVLAADDALQLHESVGPENGVPQKVFLAVYAVTAVLLLVLFLRGGRRGPTIAFLSGGALLAVSIVFDQLVDRQILIVEDGTKLLGAIVWLTVPVLAISRRARRDRPPPARDGSVELPPAVDRPVLHREHQEA